MLNDKMKRILSGPEVVAWLAQTRLKPTLLELAWSDIVELQGCFFLSPLVLSRDDASPQLKAHDATRVECEEHIHVGDYLDGADGRKPLDILAQGLLYSHELWKNLRARGSLTITLAFESPGYTPGSEVSDANVRFNMNREGGSCLDREDLDGYINAVLVLDTAADLDRELAESLQSAGVTGSSREFRGRDRSENNDRDMEPR